MIALETKAQQRDLERYGTDADRFDADDYNQASGNLKLPSRGSSNSRRSGGGGGGFSGGGPSIGLSSGGGGGGDGFMSLDEAPRIIRGGFNESRNKYEPRIKSLDMWLFIGLVLVGITITGRSIICAQMKIKPAKKSKKK